MENKIYISSTGEQKQVHILDTQYLINALAKAYRNFFETKSVKDYTNIEVLTEELNIRVDAKLNEGEE